MKVYLMQHGKPVTKEIDPDRPLSDEGRNDIKTLAKFLKDRGMKFTKIFHSGKTRAEQSAETLASVLNLDIEPRVISGLSPMDPVKKAVDTINNSEGDLLLVGHLPHLARLSAFLIMGNESPPIVSFQQGGIVCLDNSSGAWFIAWMLVPDII